MTDTMHTPKPWEATLMAARDGDWYEISGPTHGRSGAVADTQNRDPAIGPVEDRANALLIAAAPDLLEACELALAYIAHCVEPSCNEGDELEDGTIDDGTTPEGNALRAAIAKATGGDHELL